MDCNRTWYFGHGINTEHMIRLKAFVQIIATHTTEYGDTHLDELVDIKQKFA